MEILNSAPTVTVSPPYVRGIVDIAMNRAEEDRKAFKEALKIYRELEQKNPGTYLPCVATTLNNLGVFDHAQNRLEEARKALDETLKTYRELAEKNRETYLPDVALALNNL